MAHTTHTASSTNRLQQKPLGRRVPTAEPTHDAADATEWVQGGPQFSVFFCKFAPDIDIQRFQFGVIRNAIVKDCLKMLLVYADFRKIETENLHFQSMLDSPRFYVRIPPIESIQLQLPTLHRYVEAHKCIGQSDEREDWIWYRIRNSEYEAEITRGIATPR